MNKPFTYFKSSILYKVTKLQLIGRLSSFPLVQWWPRVRPPTLSFVFKGHFLDVLIDSETVVFTLFLAWLSFKMFTLICHFYNAEYGEVAWLFTTANLNSKLFNFGNVLSYKGWILTSVILTRAFFS